MKNFRRNNSPKFKYKKSVSPRYHSIGDPSLEVTSCDKSLANGLSRLEEGFIIYTHSNVLLQNLTRASMTVLSASMRERIFSISAQSAAASCSKEFSR